MMNSEIAYLSQPEPVSMGDAWFSIASTEHFWIRRRFEVLRALTPGFDWPALRLAEIGCGSGLLQRQLEDECGARVDGFDLNELALKGSVAGADLAETLARHGVKAEATSFPTPGDDAGHALLRCADDNGCDLIVMGAYGHSRLREYIFGGATQFMLSHLNRPVLLSH